ncbi:MAG: NAD(P)-dependent oxidoreductase [Thermomicrobiales bacterium]
MADSVDVLFIGSFFPESSRYLQREMPDARIAIADPRDTASPLPEAPVLVPLMSRIDGTIMDRVRGLRLIHQWGAGLEGVDIPAATARDIAVANIPTETSGNAESVAEWCVMAALALSRDLLRFRERMAAADGWGSPVGQGLAGRTAGIVGYGGIGRQLARRLRTFGMEVQVVTRSPERAKTDASAVSSVAGLDGMNALLATSDYLFLTLPLTPESRHLIGPDALRQMKSGSFLVNAGRGGLVDSDALLAALDAGAIAGAALDVFEQEPLDPASPLIGHPDVLVSPHIAGVTDRFYGNAVRQIAQAVDLVQRGEPVPWAVNARDLG